MNTEQHAEARRSVDHLIARGFIDEPNIVDRIAPGRTPLPSRADSVPPVTYSTVLF